MEYSRSWSVRLWQRVLPLLALAMGCHRGSDQPAPTPSSSAQPDVSDAYTRGAVMDAEAESGPTLRGLEGLPPEAHQVPLHDEPPAPVNSALAHTSVSVTIALPPAPQIPDAETTIRVIGPPARMCYERGIQLSGNSGRGGEITLRVAVAPTGAVETADVVTNKGLATDTAACIAATMRRLHFTAPADGNRATLQPKLTFQVAARPGELR